MYRKHIAGTIKPVIRVNKSATNPKTIGIKAPPIIAVTINPEISLLLSGILSIVMEKINGKTFANPRPIIAMDINPYN